jgi:hypothetical protein
MVAMADPPAVWLRGNRRLLAVGAAMALPVLATCAIVVVWRPVAGAIAAAPVLLLVAAALWHVQRPRIAYDGGHVLLRVRFGAPVRVPVRLVECFLVVSAPGALGWRRRHVPTTSIVVRIDQRAPEWASVETDRRLAVWCGSQATLFGTWCEPISLDLVRRLNRYLTLANQGAGKAA